MFCGRRGGKSLSGEIEDVWWLNRTKTICCNEFSEASQGVYRCPGCGKVLTVSDVRPMYGCLVAPTYTDLMDVNVKILFDWLTPDSIREWVKTEKRLVLVNGSELVFRSEDKPEQMGHGRKFDFIHFDEARDYKDFRTTWETMLPTLADYGGHAWLTTTTNGRDVPYQVFYENAAHVWKPKNQLSLDPQPPVYEHIDGKDEDFTLITFRTIDNPAIEIEEVRQAKRWMSEKMWRQEYFATIEDFRGLVYPDFDKKIHVIPRKQLDVDDLWFIGYDDAYPGTAVALLVAEDIHHNLYVVDEVYERSILIPEMAERIRGIVGDRNVELMVADPAIAKEERRSDVKGMTVQQQFSEAGIDFALANNDVRAGIDRVTQLLKGAKDGNLPGLFIFENCTNLIDEFGKYIWEERKVDDEGATVKPRKAFDHALDCLRYISMSRPDWFERITRDEYGRIRIPEGEIEFDNQLSGEGYEI